METFYKAKRTPLLFRDLFSDISFKVIEKIDENQQYQMIILCNS